MPNPSSPAITAVDVRKSFGDNVVLDGLELAVEQGSVFALLGPNGDVRMIQALFCPGKRGLSRAPGPFRTRPQGLPGLP